MDDIRIKHLLIFNKLLQFGTPERVAEALDIPSHKVLYELQMLEKYAGKKLYNKHENRVVLTDLGQKIAQISSLIEAPYNMLRGCEGDSNQEAHIKIQTSNGIAEAYIPMILEEFSRSYPNVTFEIHTGPNKLDFSDPNTDVVVGPVIHNRSDLTYDLLKDFKYYLYATDSFFHKYGFVEEKDQLKGMPFLSYSHSYFDPKKNYDMNIFLNTSSYRLIVELASLGRGICCLTEEAVNLYAKNPFDFKIIECADVAEKDRVVFTHRKFCGIFDIVEELKKISIKIFN